MGTLQRADDPEISFDLTAATLVGRGPYSTLRLDEEEVSRAHATVNWIPGWVLRDLGSSHGTFHNGRRLLLGQEIALKVGDVLGFGPRCAWRVVSTARPRASARPVGEGAPVTEREAGVLCLPTVEQPTATLFVGERGWQLEDEQGRRAVADGDNVAVAGTIWQVSLPEIQRATCERRPVLDEMEFYLARRPRGRVACRCRWGTQEEDLGARVHHNLLWLLSGAPDGLTKAEILDRLDLNDNQLDLYVYRARADLWEKAGVSTAEATRLINRADQRLRLTIDPERVHRERAG